MTAFPLLRLPIVAEALFLSAKFGWMHTPAAVYTLTWDQLMQHLVEDDILHHIPRDECLVEESMNTDQSVPRMVGSESDRRAWSPWRASRPGDMSLNTVGKVSLVELAINDCKVKMMPLWL